MRAHSTGRLGLTAVGALGHAGGAQRIVRPACGCSLLGVSSLRIWHVRFLLQPLLTVAAQFCNLFSAAQRSSAGFTSQEQTWKLRFWPQTGQIPRQPSEQTVCMGIDKMTYSRRISL